MIDQSLNRPSYRLGVTGFMTSQELRNAGYKANNGFHDQRTAMQWIKKFIGGFGGDPDEITAVGESAGGCMYGWLSGRTTANSCSVCDHVSMLEGAYNEAMPQHRRSRLVIQALTPERSRISIREDHRGFWAS